MFQHTLSSVALLVFGLSVYLLGPPTVTGEAGERFGAAVAGAADVDRDGFDDFLVGAPRADGAGPGAGRVSLYSGRDGAELLLLEGDAAADRFGAAVAGAGDVNGDGVPDLIVGSPMGTPPAGSVQLFSGADGTLCWMRAGAQPGDLYGQAVAALGDLDGDGVGEVLVGSPHSDDGGINAGRVELLSGRTGALLSAFVGQPADFLGTSVAAAGDVDADGIDDLLMGAPFADVSAFNAGSVRVISGASGALLYEFNGGATGDFYGFAVAGAGDVDADGHADVLVAAPGVDAMGIDSGLAEVRSGRDGGALLRVAGERSGDYLSAVTGLGDVDGDGRSDFAVGAASGGASGSQSGRVRVVSGGAGTVLVALEGGASEDWYGAALATAGDADADGVEDLVVGAPGHDDNLTKRGYAEVVSVRKRFRSMRRSPAPVQTRTDERSER